MLYQSQSKVVKVYYTKHKQHKCKLLYSSALRPIETINNAMYFHNISNRLPKSFTVYKSSGSGAEFRFQRRAFTTSSSTNHHWL